MRAGILINIMGGEASWRIPAAIVAATVLIVGSYVIARDTVSPAVVQAGSEEEILKQLSLRDSDADGLRDWEEVLYGTDPHKSDSQNLGMSDGEAVKKGLIVPMSPAAIASTTAQKSSIDPSIPVPGDGTLTKAVAEHFSAAYFAALSRSPSGALTDAQMRAVIDEVLKGLSGAVIPAPDFKQKSDLNMGPSDPQSFKRFAAEAEAVFVEHKMQVNTPEETRKSEIDYLKSALEDDDESAYRSMQAIAKLYQDTAVGLSRLTVPGEAVEADLLMINSLARMSKVIQDLTRADSDPITAMLALRQYPDAIRALGTSFIRINALYRTKGIAFEKDEPGANLVGLVERLAADQATKALPKPTP